ncbi:hypothetical protein AMECASPLE_018167 [Ameca splendens]|uniref:Uncharacterized protein n=1 Tax=Ameca splendens TaxID=208324 RepID=A0ABV0Y2G7_9TELE
MFQVVFLLEGKLPPQSQDFHPVSLQYLSVFNSIHLSMNCDQHCCPQSLRMLPLYFTLGVVCSGLWAVFVFPPTKSVLPVGLKVSVLVSSDQSNIYDMCLVLTLYCFFQMISISYGFL